MTNTLRRLALRLLANAVACKCPDLVPRSGEAAARVNCYSVYVDKNSEPYLLVKALAGESLECLEWSGQRFDVPKSVSFADIPTGDVSITHFYGYSEVQYKGLREFVAGRLFRLPYLKIRAVRSIESLDQYFFNKKKLVTKQRIELLRFLVARHLDGKSIKSPFELMTGLYSVKWFLHPERESQHTRLRFYLDSLVSTGELANRNGDYELTGRALQTIETYEEQERKHTESVKTQRANAWLTAAIVLLTAAQAGIIKFATLVDLSK
jgi:hypothetical protein